MIIIDLLPLKCMNSNLIENDYFNKPNKYLSL